MGRLLTIRDEGRGEGPAYVPTAEGQRLTEALAKLLDARPDLELVIRSPDTNTTGKMVNLARVGLTNAQDGIESGRVYNEDVVVVGGVKIRFETANAYAEGRDFTGITK